MRLPLIALLSAAFAGNAAAQAEPDILRHGTWAATIVAGNGARQTARLELREFAGTWYGNAGPATSVTGPCRARKFPVTVQQSNASGLAFTVWGKTAGAGCADLTVDLKPTAEQVFEGTVESVGTIRLVPARR